MFNEKWLSKPILIGGFEKTGTNLMVSLLDNHPNLVVFSEGHLHLFSDSMISTSSLDSHNKVKYLLELPVINRLKYGKIIFGARSTKTKYITFENDLFDWNVFCDTLKNIINNESNWIKIIKALYIAYYRANPNLRRNKNLLGFVESSPGNEIVADLLYSFFPRGKMINMVRDPRDNWAAWKLQGYDRTIWQFIRLWFIFMKSSIQNRFKFGDNRYLIQSYEELVFHPRQVMEKIAFFLKIPFNETLLEPTKHGLLWPGNSAYNQEFKEISSNSVNKYKEILSKSEIKILDTYCVPLYKYIKSKNKMFRVFPPYTKYFGLMNIFTHKKRGASVKKYLADLFGFIVELEAVRKIDI